MPIWIKSDKEKGGFSIKLYSIGTLGFIATVTSLVVNIQINEQFNITYPYLFWIGQIVLCIFFIGTLIYILFHWDNKLPFTKIRLSLSILISILMYAIAYTGSKYSFILILLVGLTEIYFTRKRANLIKYDYK